MNDTLELPTNSEATRAGKQFLPRVDIHENDQELLLIAEVPGVDPEGIDLRFERGELVLHAKVKDLPQAGNPLVAEFEVGDYHRVFRVHESIDASKIEAELKNGLLFVHLPKEEQHRPKQLTVKVA
ncbi:MAG: Hsp20/alpha crystallin family protein [Gemmataceae bacterium]